MHARHSLQRLDDNLSRLEKMVAMMLKAEGVQTPAELRSKLQERVEQADNTAAANYKLERLETLTNEQKVQQNQKDEILQRMKAIAPIMLGEAQDRAQSEYKRFEGDTGKNVGRPNEGHWKDPGQPSYQW